MKTVYAVSRGCYSDYHVLCVCDDEATAKAFVAAMNADKDKWDDARVETLRSFPAGSVPRRVTDYWHNVELWDDGRIEDGGLRSSERWEFEEPPWHAGTRRPRLRFVRAPCHKNKGGRMEVSGLDSAAVEKVVADRLRMWRAGAWITKKLAEFNLSDADGEPST